MQNMAMTETGDTTPTPSNAEKAITAAPKTKRSAKASPKQASSAKTAVDPSTETEVVPSKPLAKTATPVPAAPAAPAAPSKAKTKAVSAPVKSQAVKAKTPTPKAQTKAEAKDVKPKTKATSDTPAKPAKEKKVKVVRDSFTLPKTELLQIAAMKKRALSLGVDVKKSELIRAGLQALSGMSDAPFKKALASIPTIKTGRPAKD
jgi:hypothetical protein